MSEALISVFKDGSISQIHPDTLRSHQLAGWKLIPSGTAPAIGKDDQNFMGAAAKRIASLEAEVASLKIERDGWQEEARRYAANSEHHQAERERLEALLGQATESQKGTAPAGLPGPDAPYPDKQVPHWPTDELRRKARALGLDDSMDRPALITAISEAAKA